MIPSSVRIGCAEWEVRANDAEVPKEDAEGLCDRQAHRISIAPNLTADGEEETFLHELLHACVAFAGMADGKKYDEEEFIGRISPILHTVLRENGSWSWQINKAHRVER